MPSQNDDNNRFVTDGHSSSGSQPVAPSTKTDLVGMVIGDRYSVREELARGGMGVVYLAHDKPELLSRRVVLKVLLEDSLKNEWVVRKFHQEIESLTRLDNPGIVAIFDAGKLDDGSPYIVMQYVDGVSLRREIRPGGMSFERVANIIRQMGRSLSAAHDRDVIHRDLKPENVMLCQMTGGDEQVKIIDFGIAKVKNSIVATSTVTGLSVGGTIAYMSQEQLQAQRVTPASDVYALGVIAYEMLTGIRPFNPETGFQLLEMQRDGVRVRPKDLRPALPERAQDVILKALAFDPKMRYQSAQEFGNLLARALIEEIDTPEISTRQLNQKEDAISADDAAMSLASTARAPSAMGMGQRKKEEIALAELPEKLNKRRKRSIPALAMTAALLMISVGLALFIWMPWSRKIVESTTTDSKPQVTTPALANILNYSLTVQKMIKDPKTSNYRPLGEPFESTGQEIYGNGWRFRVNITPGRDGSLYLFNEGAGANGSTVYNVLFPTRANNNRVAQLTANQTIRTENYFFDDYTGTEKLWIVWSSTPLEKLEDIFKDADENRLVISDPQQIKTVRDLLARYDSSKPEVVIDKTKKQTSIKSTGDISISLLELQHESY